MRISGGVLSLAAVFAAVAARSESRAQAAPDPRSFATHATFTVDGTHLALSTAVATIEPIRYAQGYSWVRIYFYAFPLSAQNVEAALRGDVKPIEHRWEQTSGNPSEYNRTHAEVQLTVNKDGMITQLDMSVPGHGCTVAWQQADLARIQRTSRYDGKRVRLQDASSYVCGPAPETHTFTWNIDLDLPAYSPSAGTK